MRGDIVARHACASYGHWDTNTEGYQQLLLNDLLPIWDHDHLLLQDNATPTQSCVLEGFSLQMGIMVINNWPALSPDLHVMGNMWKMVGDPVGS